MSNMQYIGVNDTWAWTLFFFCIYAFQCRSGLAALEMRVTGSTVELFML